MAGQLPNNDETDEDEAAEDLAKEILSDYFHGDPRRNM